MLRYRSQFFPEIGLFSYFTTSHLRVSLLIQYALRADCFSPQDRGSLWTPDPSLPLMPTPLPLTYSSPSSLLYITSISMEGAYTHVWCPVFAAVTQSTGPWIAWLREPKGLAFTSPTRLQQTKNQLLMGTGTPSHVRLVATHLGSMQRDQAKNLSPVFSLEEP